MSNSSGESMADKMANKMAKALGDAFEHVALTRRAHFEQHPNKRPGKAEVESIITSYANQNAVFAGAANMVPGPWGMLAVLPELTLIIRNQIQMIYDLGVAHGKEAQLDSKMLLAIFATVMGGSAIGLATVKGGQLLVKRASLRVIQKIIIWLGGKITQRVLKQLVAKWLPVVGAAAMAIWARQSTVSMGRAAADLLKLEINDGGELHEDDVDLSA